MKIDGRKIVLLSLIISYSQIAVGAENNSKSDPANDTIVVTASGREEQQRKSTVTTQVIDSEQIERAHATSLTDLLAQNSVGFFSEWSPGQTSVNIRGAATDGQGKDFAGQILVLVNGRRAGTANLSKLSPKDVSRIEIIRGPSSVIYGSQAMGGVINIFLKNGLTDEGGKLSVETGSWGLAQTYGGYGFQNDNGDIYGYFGFEAGRRDDYHSGKGGHKQENTNWERFGLSGNVGWKIDENNLVDLSLRTDGIYDGGFRGSTGNIYAKDTRYNRSADLVWKNGNNDSIVSMNTHAYFIQDVDNFRWASPLTAKTSSDHNRRALDIYGIKFQPIIKIHEQNDLLLGVDYEHSRLRSERHQVSVSGKPIKQSAPYDNNQTENLYAFYFDDKQSLFDDSWIIRGGMRYTYGKTDFDKTPHLDNQFTGSTSYNKLTWSLGTNYQVNEWLNLKSSLATGYRAPTATQLGADYTTLSGAQYLGNNTLNAESNRQIEVGAIIGDSLHSVDISLFQNTIQDRIQTDVISPNVYQYANSENDIVVRGLEINSRTAVNSLMNWQTDWDWVLRFNGSWNFDMEDKGAQITATNNSTKVQRMYQYQGAVINDLYFANGQYPWSIQLQGILRGPMWYKTEEGIIPEVRPYTSYVMRKSPFMVWNLHADVDISPSLTFYGRIDNILNKNEHPVFFALDEDPYIMLPSKSNGSLGTSMPGRSFIAGVSYRF
ncbi:TonB-dependent receptor [Morganella psychrotolerans]|uniref:TonB-dependent receptor n=1 Tax=Morganella psychrotolerans TaxID=368603 RepID=A0A5M9R8C8_9GAMM|nr:TonB-dependent receptor [Morganella psychrotolerans]KAA8717214.1 TonB-dependent receptor [Morganella psychrotolerans]OBU08492.1 vitamin B12 receptor [Morganella psychrotolerans]